MAQVLLLATLATKVEEADFLLQQLNRTGVSVEVIDISLQTGGKTLGGAEKCLAMSDAADHALETIRTRISEGSEVVVGIGGGTGGEINLQVMRSLPITFPKLLCTTLPFDPRYAVADNSIIIVPTLADISGLNGMLREALENTALMAAGLCNKPRKGELTSIVPSVGITALGVTEGAVRPLVRSLQAEGREATVFHSNGFGGAAFARFADQGAFDAIIDLTPHELTRIHLAGAHVAMPKRFQVAPDLPRIVLPGGLNFIGLGQKALVPPHFLERPHYEHSGLFTHVKVTAEEMETLAVQLADDLNGLTGPRAVILPMGGFSSHDRPGGAIEDRALRDVCADTLTARLNPDIGVQAIEAHISAPEITDAILSTLAELTA